MHKHKNVLFNFNFFTPTVTRINKSYNKVRMNTIISFWVHGNKEKCRSIIKTFFRNAQAAFIVYDICRRESFESVDYWVKEAREYGEERIL